LNLTILTGLSWPLRTIGRIVDIQFILMQGKQTQVEQDIKQYKVKEGFLFQRSRLTK
jgi:hypothetical protein